MRSILAGLALPFAVAACTQGLPAPSGGGAVTGIYLQSFQNDADDCEPQVRSFIPAKETVLSVGPDRINVEIPSLIGNGYQRFDLEAGRGWAMTQTFGFGAAGPRFYDVGEQPAECVVQRSNFELRSGRSLPVELAWTDTFTVTPPCEVPSAWLPRASCRSARRSLFELEEACEPPARIVPEEMRPNPAFPPYFVYHCER